MIEATYILLVLLSLLLISAGVVNLAYRLKADWTREGESTEGER